MLITPSFCAQSYAYNGRAEQVVANYLAKITGMQVKDFSEGVRPEYDFLIGDDRGFVQVELKTTGSKWIPVETHKDQARTIEAGLLTSTSPIVVTLSLGVLTGYKGDIGKLRVFDRKKLLQQAGQNGTGRFYPSANVSEGSYSYSFAPRHDSHHVWLGNVPVIYERVSQDTDISGNDIYVVSYDMERIFDDDPLRRLELIELINKHRGIDE